MSSHDNENNYTRQIDHAMQLLKSFLVQAKETNRFLARGNSNSSTPESASSADKAIENVWASVIVDTLTREIVEINLESLLSKHPLLLQTKEIISNSSNLQEDEFFQLQETIAIDQLAVKRSERKTGSVVEPTSLIKAELNKFISYTIERLFHPR